ncbi:hypothetical protein [Bradyrhizobium sp. 1(2017)]|uniref:hypothetical protein n=1 Tax=Bradyrhizobium sp. 1(2017) TaxID=1404888 RepID=UPI00140EEED1|nr:hypothetical protein [Bradyrhizobium sp. 1(2017)]QIO33481.1 hypothetical protein HAP40_17505 [Bradyrhizobium sp. 1(2017)]
MKSDPLRQDARLQAEVSAQGTDTNSKLLRRWCTRIAGELRQALPPTIFFFVGFNLIVLTTNLLVASYAVAVSSFMLATVAALVVGKAVITANSMPFLKIFDRAPLIQPILFKTAVYWVATVITRLAERFMHFSVIDGNWPGDFPTHLISDFSWQRFTAISLWILVLFLIYTTVSEFSNLFGSPEMWRLFFTYRPSELQLNRRQRARELMRLHRLADEHDLAEFRDPDSPAHHALVEVIERLARTPQFGRDEIALSQSGRTRQQS